ncbi:MAG: FAD binding domain-containing protein, partial [Planctomycetes bacterium]|nr:FAD binding domain-containing protein [Planctomycetota bacterium]
KKVASVLIQEQATIGGNALLDTRCHFFNQSYFWRTSLGYCLKADGTRCHVVPKIKRDGQLVENGNECFATNCSDFAPVLGAEYELAGPKGTRKVKASEFYHHDGRARFVKEPGEMLVAIHFPERAKTLTAGYKKLRPRESWDFPSLGVAAAIARDGKGKLEHFALSVNAVDTYPIVFNTHVNQYLGKQLDDGAIDAIAEHVKTTVQPKLTVPMEPGYRKKMAAVFTRRLLKELAV